jgi:hypothetical protein
MRFHPGAVAAAIAFSLVASACAGEGSSGAEKSGAVALPAIGSHVRVAHGGRRPHDVPSCSGSGTGSFVGGGFENVADGAYSGVLEGNSNEVCDEESSVGGGYYNFVSSGANTSYYSWIGSGYDNSISGNGYQSVIGGGNVNSLTAPNSVIGGGNQNTVSASDSVVAGGSTNAVSGSGYAAIGGGSGNTANAEYATLGGGSGNTASGEYATIAGGYSNQDSALSGTVGGGRNNVATGKYSTVSGGYANTAGDYAVVPGGYDNSANGEFSFAGGYNSTAAYTGDFVWSDYTSGETPLAATASDQFFVRSVGGVVFYTSANLASGVRLTPGSGTWASLSDRNAKSHVLPVSDDVILSKIAAMPISEWSYTTEGHVRHVGPMAQDFYAAFSLGADDRHITSIDEDGVALAAIKALDAKLAQKDAAIADLRRQLATLSAKVDALAAGRK